MKICTYDKVTLTEGYLFDKEELNRKITIGAVYDRFDETGRVGAFDCTWREGDDLRPHHFWDSDVAKWMEGASYILQKHDAPDLQEKIEKIIAKIKKNQDKDGYFNSFFMTVMPDARLTDRDKHELYCAGHLIEAAVAYAEATGREEFLHLMERYADYIYRVFVKKDPALVQAKFTTPGHEEIELALLRLYAYTRNPKHLELAEFFLNNRGVAEEDWKSDYNQSHLPVREQTEAVGHAVRALYLYCGMASLAKETGDEALVKACKALWEDLTQRKMYVTGAFGSTCIGETFTAPYDLPMDTAYAETCAAIAMMLLGNRMLELENDARYADMVERSLYNGMLAGISLDGKAFFYENPLEINLSERFENRWGKRKLAITQRVECFRCSCCPPNLNRILSSLGNYIYGTDGDTLYVNQYTASTLADGGVTAEQRTDYPRSGAVRLRAEGVKTVALRIPGWCEKFTVNRPYTMKNGYAMVANEGEIEVIFDMIPRVVFADPRIIRAAHRMAIMRGPVVYCAEGVDNGENLHGFAVSPDFTWEEQESDLFGLPTLTVSTKRLAHFEGGLYSHEMPKRQDSTLKLIPYSAFANRGESDMTVWLWRE